MKKRVEPKPLITLEQLQEHKKPGDLWIGERLGWMCWSSVSCSCCILSEGSHGPGWLVAWRESGGPAQDVLLWVMGRWGKSVAKRVSVFVSGCVCFREE